MTFAGVIRTRNPCIGDFHQFLAAARHGDIDVSKAIALKPEAGSLVVVRATDPAKLVLGGLLELFDAILVEVLKHRKHFNMDLFEVPRARGDLPPQAFQSAELGSKPALWGA